MQKTPPPQYLMPAFARESGRVGLNLGLGSPPPSCFSLALSRPLWPTCAREARADAGDGDAAHDRREDLADQPGREEGEANLEEGGDARGAEELA